MSFMTSRTGLLARNVARRIGLVPILARLLKGRSYEANFDAAVQDCIRPGDTVWDVGANIGFYTRKFAERAGADGRVIAIEASPVTAEKLRAQVAGLANVEIVNKGLGARPARFGMIQDESYEAHSSRLVDEGDSAQSFVVELVTGDSLLETGQGPPQVIKIDVEGHELDVLRGMEKVLAARELRSVCMEIHFEQLRDRGIGSAPREIERRLRAGGFSIRWTDPSHIIASRT
jgi:FkbM family methyltransferase